MLNKYKKEDENDMAADVAQCECSNIKFYVSAFSNILIIYYYIIPMCRAHPAKTHMPLTWGS